jgi:hypothetical protein
MLFKICEKKEVCLYSYTDIGLWKLLWPKHFQGRCIFSDTKYYLESKWAWHQWFIHLILAAWEAEIGRVTLQVNWSQKVGWEMLISSNSWRQWHTYVIQAMERSLKQDGHSLGGLGKKWDSVSKITRVKRM